ncbi:hypothetical protein DC60_24475 [Streptomyces wadayamensis]|uniref:Uncharacterized protein n=1 Tax=Streptomyces wadayamensis TaxID=141454 RepID=A0ABR4S997_9ACTN|nr:hypothetical protein DC60_24475 [Streptomyces wadayamensis]
MAARPPRGESGRSVAEGRDDGRADGVAVECGDAPDAGPAGGADLLPQVATSRLSARSQAAVPVSTWVTSSRARSRGTPRTAPASIIASAR